jgi:hypothetical protein
MRRGRERLLGSAQAKHPRADETGLVPGPADLERVQDEVPALGDRDEREGVGSETIRREDERRELMPIEHVSDREVDRYSGPPRVRRYLERALAVGGDAAPDRVRVGQAGEMWLKPGGRSLRFTAVEEFAVE